MYSKIAFASSTRVFHRRESSSSTCIRDQNASIIALSYQSPTDPIDGTSPDRLARSVNAQEVNPGCVRGPNGSPSPRGRRRAARLPSRARCL
jgi:hypothetical protein